jgi:hypothetical protein
MVKRALPNQTLHLLFQADRGKNVRKHLHNRPKTATDCNPILLDIGVKYSETWARMKVQYSDNCEYTNKRSLLMEGRQVLFIIN